MRVLLPMVSMGFLSSIFHCIHVISSKIRNYYTKTSKTKLELHFHTQKHFNLALNWSWWFEPFDLHNQWSHLLPPLPRATQLRSPKAGGEPNPLPTSPFLRGWFCTLNLTRVTAVQSINNPRTDTTNVGRQEHDVRSRSSPRPLPYSLRHVPWQDEHKRSWWTDNQRPKQELVVLRRMDPEQRQVECLRYPANWVVNVFHFHGQLYFHSRDV